MECQVYFEREDDDPANSMLVKTNKPNACVQPISGNPNNSGSNQFHNHITGNASSKERIPIITAIAITPLNTVIKVFISFPKDESVTLIITYQGEFVKDY